MEIAGFALARESLDVPPPIFVLDPRRLLVADEARQRVAPHMHRRFEQFAIGTGEVEPADIHQVDAVIGADIDRRLRESLEDRFEPGRGEAVAVDAE